MQVVKKTGDNNIYNAYRVLSVFLRNWLTTVCWFGCGCGQSLLRDRDRQKYENGIQ